MTHEDIVFYTKLGICPQCRKQMLWGDEKTCLECRTKQSAAQDKRYERKRVEILQYHKDKRERLKAEGICTRCGKNPRDKTLLCKECSEKVRKYKRHYYSKLCEKPTPLGVGWIAHKNVYKYIDNIHKMLQ